MTELQELDAEFNTLLEKIQVVAEKRRELQGFTKRNTLYPLKNEKERRALEFYHKQQRALWVPHEMNFGIDIPDYEALTEEYKRLIDIPFAFFAGADGSVIDMLAIRFLLEPETYHELCFYLVQLYIESVHAETYALLITQLIPDEKKRTRLLTSSKNDPVIRPIHEWIDGFLTGTYADVERKAGVALMEGAIFQAPFLFIFYFKTNGKMKNIRFANEQISKDEALHADKGCDFVKEWREEHGTQYDESIYRIAEQARQLVRYFSAYVLTDPVTGKAASIPQLELESVFTYCDLIVNTVLFRFGMKQAYEVDHNKIPAWMDSIADTIKGNFYESSIGNYAQFSKNDLTSKEGEEEDIDDVDF